MLMKDNTTLFRINFDCSPNNDLGPCSQRERRGVDLQPAARCIDARHSLGPFPSKQQSECLPLG